MDYNPIRPTGNSNWSVEIRKLQDFVRSLRITNVVNGEFKTTSNGTSIVCNAKSNATGSTAVATDPTCRWI